LGEAKIKVFLNISLLQSEQKDTTDWTWVNFDLPPEPKLAYHVCSSTCKIGRFVSVSVW
jgi:hypothetical protein